MLRVCRYKQIVLLAILCFAAFLQCAHSAEVLLLVKSDTEVLDGIKKAVRHHDVKVVVVDPKKAFLAKINEAGARVGSDPKAQQGFIDNTVKQLDMDKLRRAVGEEIKWAILAAKYGIKSFPAVLVKKGGKMKATSFTGDVYQVINAIEKSM